MKNCGPAGRCGHWPLDKRSLDEDARKTYETRFYVRTNSQSFLSQYNKANWSWAIYATSSIRCQQLISARTLAKCAQTHWKVCIILRYHIAAVVCSRNVPPASKQQSTRSLLHVGVHSTRERLPCLSCSL